MSAPAQRKNSIPAELLERLKPLEGTTRTTPRPSPEEIREAFRKGTEERRRAAAHRSAGRSRVQANS